MYVAAAVMGAAILSMSLVALLVFALWLERFTRGYGEIGGPPEEMKP